MFGYIHPDKPELKIKEFEMFKGYYCGLCKKLNSEYTFFSRFFLNYDCTFLSVLLSGVSNHQIQVKKETCIVSPFKKKNIVHCESEKFAAAVNVILAYNSIIDNIKDEKKIHLYPLIWMLKRGYNKAKKDFQKAANVITTSLKELNEFEKNHEKDIDKVSHVFANMMGELIAYACENDKEAAYHLGYYIGRWIYIIDAFDDIEKDIKTKSYNPILLKFDYCGQDIKSFKDNIADEVKFSLIYSLSEAAKAFDLLKIYKHEGMLENIIYSGTKKKTESVLLKGEQ